MLRSGSSHNYNGAVGQSSQDSTFYGGNANQSFQGQGQKFFPNPNTNQSFPNMQNSGFRPMPPTAPHSQPQNMNPNFCRGPGLQPQPGLQPLYSGGIGLQLRGMAPGASGDTVQDGKGNSFNGAGGSVGGGACVGVAGRGDGSCNVSGGAVKLRASLERALLHVEKNSSSCGNVLGNEFLSPRDQGIGGGGSLPSSALGGGAGVCSDGGVQAVGNRGNADASQRDSSAQFVRGRKAVFQRIQNTTFGVASPSQWCSQQDECDAQCRRDVGGVVSSCRASGEKFTDPDFPPSNKSLYVNGEKPASSTKMPTGIEWVRIPNICPGANTSTLEVKDDSRMRSGFIDDTAFLSAVGLLRAAQHSPDELIVQHDLSAGVIGIRLFKDGGWVYEIIDDYLPCIDGVLACGLTTAPCEVWIALLEKANAKIHGSYEAVQRTTELEALEDLTGAPVRRLDRREVANGGEELVRGLGERQQLGCCLHLAMRRRERRGEEHESGLLSGHGYPITEAEQNAHDGINGMRCRLENPWMRGGYRGGGRGAATLNCTKGGSVSSHASGENGTTGVRAGSFVMEASEMANLFTELLEVRLPPFAWPVQRVMLSTDRPSYPLLSARMVTQCILSCCQADRRWSPQDSYLNGIGIRVYRCRVLAPPTGRQGGRQDPNANPFEPLELLRRRPLGKTRSTCVEFTMEAHALYIVAVDSQYRCPFCLLRFASSADVQFRELSAPEAGHFIKAQGSSTMASDILEGGGMLPRSMSEDNEADWRGEESCGWRGGEDTACGSRLANSSPCIGDATSMGFGGRIWNIGGGHSGTVSCSRPRSLLSFFSPFSC